MTTQLGTIAGVVDPSWRDPQIKTGDMIRPPTVVDGLFVAGFRRSGPIEVSNGGKSWTAMPAPAETPVTVVDARQGPAPDRTSGRGKLLGDCIDAVMRMGDGVIDSDSWEPGAMAESEDNRMIVTRNAYGYSTCSHSVKLGYGSFGTAGGSVFYRADKSANQGPAPAVLTEDPGMDVTMFVYGVVPPDSRRVEVIFAGAAPIEADVANSTFVAPIPQSVVRGPNSAITYRIHNTAGQLTYDGPAQR